MLQLFKVEDIRLLGVRPAQESGKVHEGCSKNALGVHEEAEVDIRIAFAELLSRLVHEERYVAELRRRPLEGVVKRDVHGGRGHPFLGRA